MSTFNLKKNHCFYYNEFGHRSLIFEIFNTIYVDRVDDFVGLAVGMIVLVWFIYCS